MERGEIGESLKHLRVGPANYCPSGTAHFAGGHVNTLLHSIAWLLKGSAVYLVTDYCSEGLSPTLQTKKKEDEDNDIEGKES